jgi:4-aminobutyrate--pyruvate transaminase
MEERDVIGHVRAVAPRFAARLAAVAEHPLVGDVRSIGLLGGVELVPSTEDAPGARAAALRAACEREGLLVRACAVGDTIAFCPPLVITEPEIDEAFDRFEKALG